MVKEGGKRVLTEETRQKQHLHRFNWNHFHIESMFSNECTSIYRYIIDSVAQERSSNPYEASGDGSIRYTTFHAVHLDGSSTLDNLKEHS